MLLNFNFKKQVCLLEANAMRKLSGIGIRIFTLIMGSFQNLCKESTIGHLYWMTKIVEKSC